MLRLIALACAAIAAVFIVGGGCTTRATAPIVPPSSPTPSPSHSPGASPSPVPSPQFFVILAYASAKPTIDPTFGEVDGFSLATPTPKPTPRPSSSPTSSPTPNPTLTPGPPQVINLTGGEFVRFFNLDHALLHTASLLSPVTGPTPTWPPTFTNSNGASVSSPQLTPITTPEFSTGTLIPGGTASFVYGTGVPGMYYFGDFYNYLSVPPMRTVIVVH